MSRDSAVNKRSVCGHAKVAPTASAMALRGQERSQRMAGGLTIGCFHSDVSSDCHIRTRAELTRSDTSQIPEPLLHEGGEAAKKQEFSTQEVNHQDTTEYFNLILRQGKDNMTHLKLWCRSKEQALKWFGGQPDGQVRRR